MSELKPCPFCGGEAKLRRCDGSGAFHAELTCVSFFGREMSHYLIRCDGCGIKTKAYKTEKGVFKAWNRRVDNE